MREVGKYQKGHRRQDLPETYICDGYIDAITTTGKIQCGGELEGTSLDINGTADIAGSLHITQNAGTLNLVGVNHSYIQWYPDGLSSGRKAYTGYGGATDNSFSIVNEIIPILIRNFFIKFWSFNSGITPIRKFIL